MRISKLGCLLAAALTATALTAATGAAVAQEAKIGFNVPLTGFAAADGKSALNGAELAVEQANEAGGIDGKQIKLVVYDDQASSTEAVTVATKMIEQDGVKVGVSGSYSAATRAAAQVFQAAGIPYVSAYGIHPDITRTGDYIFRSTIMGEVQGRAGAKLIGDILGKKRVVMITMNNDFGQALAKGFKDVADQFGIEIVGEYEYGLKDRQFGAIVAQVKANDPEAIYASGYYFTAGPLVTQLRAAGVDATIVGQEGYDGQSFIDIAGKAAEGVIITTSLDRDSEDPNVQKFLKEFEEKAGYPADMVAASTHTAVNVVIDAMRRAGTEDPAAIRDAIAATDLKAVTGAITFNDLGEVRKDVQVQIVKDGAWHHYAVISDDKLLAPPES